MKPHARIVAALVLPFSLCCPAGECAAASPADGYPAKPIRFVVPFAPGGGNDIVARIFAEGLRESLGQVVVVDNRGGAGSTIGTDVVAKAPSDGYTLLLGAISLAFNHALYKRLPYDALQDFAPVSLLAQQPSILVVHPALPAPTLKDFVALARAQPDKFTYGSSGVGTGTHLAMEMLAQTLNIKLLHVPYKGTGPAVAAVLGSEITLLLSTFASAYPHVEAHRLRALGVSSAKRVALVPQVPTIAEAGVPGYDYATWYGLLVPAHTPRAVIDRLNRAAVDVLRSARTRQLFDAQGLEPEPSTAAEFTRYLRAETEKWSKVVHSAGIALQ
ncbi:MAG TPA: tripartite tricarboxylate transporter substrate binding protein [Burkholderiales bacterium]|nr:tripartite tricarboxylate transporter substrate binding protein [Burkholderiales bacterium]